MKTTVDFTLVCTPDPRHDWRITVLDTDMFIGTMRDVRQLWPRNQNLVQWMAKKIVVDSQTNPRV